MSFVNYDTKKYPKCSGLEKLGLDPLPIPDIKIPYNLDKVRKAAKKVPPLVVRPLSLTPPPPQSWVVIATFFQFLELQKVFLPLSPSPLSGRPTSEGTFFAVFLKDFIYVCIFICHSLSVFVNYFAPLDSLSLFILHGNNKNALPWIFHVPTGLFLAVYED